MWEGLDPARVTIIPPSIDVFSRQEPAAWATNVARAILQVAGLLAGDGGVDHDGATYLHEDGTPGRVDRAADIVQDAPLARGDRYVTQVSRWDRLKDPVGVLARLGRARSRPATAAHLVLAGPAVDGRRRRPRGRRPCSAR